LDGKQRSKLSLHLMIWSLWGHFRWRFEIWNHFSIRLVNLTFREDLNYPIACKFEAFLSSFNRQFWLEETKSMKATVLTDFFRDYRNDKI
jgi:hypothetical protein